MSALDYKEYLRKKNNAEKSEKIFGSIEKSTTFAPVKQTS